MFATSECGTCLRKFGTSKLVGKIVSSISALFVSITVSEAIISRGSPEYKTNFYQNSLNEVQGFVYYFVRCLMCAGRSATVV